MTALASILMGFGGGWFAGWWVRGWRMFREGASEPVRYRVPDPPYGPMGT